MRVFLQSTGNLYLRVHFTGPEAVQNVQLLTGISNLCVISHVRGLRYYRSHSEAYNKDEFFMLKKELIG